MYLRKGWTMRTNVFSKIQTCPARKLKSACMVSHAESCLHCNVLTLSPGLFMSVQFCGNLAGWRRDVAWIELTNNLVYAFEAVLQRWIRGPKDSTRQTSAVKRQSNRQLFLSAFTWRTWHKQSPFCWKTDVSQTTAFQCHSSIPALLTWMSVFNSWFCGVKNGCEEEASCVIHHHLTLLNQVCRAWWDGHREGSTLRRLHVFTGMNANASVRGVFFLQIFWFFLNVQNPSVHRTISFASRICEGYMVRKSTFVHVWSAPYDPEPWRFTCIRLEEMYKLHIISLQQLVLRKRVHCVEILCAAAQSRLRALHDTSSWSSNQQTETRWSYVMSVIRHDMYRINLRVKKQTSCCVHSDYWRWEEKQGGISICIVDRTCAQWCKRSLMAACFKANQHHHSEQSKKGKSTMTNAKYFSFQVPRG